MAKPTEKKLNCNTFYKTVKEVLFNKPQAHSEDRYPTREELDKKWRLDHRKK